MTVPTITTAADFANWLTAGPVACVYHIGNLAKDREDALKKYDKDTTINTLANAVWKAAISSKVYLLQREHPKGFEYLAIKPRDGKVPEAWTPESCVSSPIQLEDNDELLRP